MNRLEKAREFRNRINANLQATRKLIRVDELSEKELIEIIDLYEEYKEDYPYEKGDIFKYDNQLYEVEDSHTSEKEIVFDKSSKLYKNITTKQEIGGRV